MTYEDDQQENRFMMNMTRLLGSTVSITPDYVFEFLVFLQNHGIIELQFLEERYTSVLFDDEEFLSGAGIHVCSLEVLIDRYEEAKKSNNAEVLGHFRRVHRIARQFFEPEETKAIIRNFIQERKQAYDRKLFFGFFRPMVLYLERIGTNNVIGAMVSEMIPQLSSAPALRAVMSPHKFLGPMVEI